MFTYLFNKLPAVRRLLAAVGSAEAKVMIAERALALNREEFKRLNDGLSRAQDEIVHVKEQRNQARNELGGLREIVVKQSASIDILTKDRERGERRIAELGLQVGENTDREERFMRTIDNLNSTLNARNAELEDTRAELAAAQTTLARQARPVLFKRTGGLSDEELDLLLAGKGHVREVAGILQLLEECATQATAEACAAPALPIDGPQPMRGFSAEDRTFSSGGVFALVRFKGTLEEKLAARVEEKKAA